MSRVSNNSMATLRLFRWISLQVVLMLVIAVAVYYRYDLFPAGRPEKLLSGLTAHSVTIMSILVAAGAILMSIASTRLIRNLVKTKHYHRLVDSLLMSIILFLICATTGIISLYLSADTERLCFSLITGLFAGGLVNFAVTGHKLYIVLSSLHQRPSN